MALRTGPDLRALRAFLAFAIAFAVVACQVLLVQGQERLDTLHADIAEQDGRYQELRLDVAELESPARIVAAATELGMVTAARGHLPHPAGAVTVQGRLRPQSGRAPTPSGGEQG